MLEAAASAVVGVRHSLVIVLAAETDEGRDFFRMSSVRIQSEDIGEVFLVHGDDEIEVIQIRSFDLTGVSADVVAFFSEGFGHAGIRRGALVVSDGAGGVDFKSVRHAAGCSQVAEDDFRGG